MTCTGNQDVTLSLMSNFNFYQSASCLKPDACSQPDCVSLSLLDIQSDIRYLFGETFRSTRLYKKAFGEIILQTQLNRYSEISEFVITLKGIVVVVGNEIKLWSC